MVALIYLVSFLKISKAAGLRPATIAERFSANFILIAETDLSSAGLDAVILSSANDASVFGDFNLLMFSLLFGFGFS